MPKHKIQWKRFILRDTTAPLEWSDKLFYFWDKTFMKRMITQRAANRILFNE